MPPVDDEARKWPSYVDGEIRRLTSCVSDLEKTMVELRIDYASFKSEMNFKTKLWSAMLGMVPATVALIYFYLNSQK